MDNYLMNTFQKKLQEEEQASKVILVSKKSARKQAKRDGKESPERKLNKSPDGEHFRLVVPSHPSF